MGTATIVGAGANAYATSSSEAFAFPREHARAACMMERMTWRSLLPFGLLPFWAAVLASGCDCGGPPATSCTTTSDCADGFICRDGTCQPAAQIDGGTTDGATCAPERLCAGGRICCAEGEECVDDFACAPICENARCGDNGLVCCAAGQVCLDGVVCAAACEADRALCGAALDVCCEPGDVCVDDACVTPGDECGDDYDCLEEGTYCEHTIGRCLPNPRPPLCEVRPEFDRVALEIEWHWAGVMVGSTLYANVITAPIVGDVSGDGIPDVVVPAYAGSSLGNTVMVAIHGGTGETLWVVSGTDACTSEGAPALANLDPSDDALEIAYVARSADLIVLDGDGTTELARFPSATTAISAYAAVSIHDLDRDGSPEIIVGARAFAFETTPGGFSLRSLFDAGPCNVNGAHSVVANLDSDPELEITCGGVAYDTDGSLMWPSSGATAGYAAVADLDLDGAPEVVMVRSSQVTVRDGATGALRMGPGGDWFDGQLSIPNGGTGGPPTIADFDGDGLPEISAAGQGAYAVYDPDCVEPRIPGREAGTCDRMAGTTGALRWASPVQDLSSSRTGSSVFDFQGDGIAEVVYNDECFLHVFDGRDGREILMEPFANSSRTSHEYPIVVDVDRDGNSEIVVPANNDQIARDGCLASWRTAFGVATDAELPERIRNGTQGIYALGDPADRWVRTRPIWNQFAYAVTHVDDRGNVPAAPVENWRTPGLNNFRQNVQGAGVFNAPNLTVELDVVAACGRREVRLSALVRNVGSRGVPAGVPVEFVQTAPAPGGVIATLATTRPLLPGGSERITAVATDQPFDVPLTFTVRVDGDSAASTIAECNEDDNAADGTETCPGLE